jgi:hypothetical protein
MIQSRVQKARSRRLSASFDRLSEKDQAYLETLTSRLADIHETSPEKKIVAGKKPKIVVQQNKEQEN